MSSNFCPVCVRAVLDSDEGICCDSACQRWFHRECVKMPKSEYLRISGDNKIRWNCFRVDCLAPTDQPLGKLSTQMTSVLLKLDALLAKVNKIDDLAKDVNNIQTEISSMKAGLSALEPRIVVAEEKVANVEIDIAAVRTEVSANTTKLNKLENNANTSLDEAVAEVNDRASRLKNVLLHKVPESKKSSPSEMKEDDRKMLVTMFDALDFKPDSMTFYRLGQKTSRKIRPLKVVFGSQVEAALLLKKFSRDAFDDVDPSLSEVSISRDRTPNERATLDSLRQEMGQRTAAGETNLTIKYFNGVPKIITSKPKN